jgi:large-conductance mechanosensitive channel
MPDNTATVVLGCVIGLIIVVVFGAAFAWIAMLLWNGIVVPTFGAPLLSFWQMWGIIILLNLLFGGLRASTSSRVEK